ncbi:MAG TPA: hypothetical protein VJ939_06865 [Bacteroidales bacterium]|nr:hypothetical protein [Bacteroidales bacterium]
MKKAVEHLGRIIIVASIVWMLHNYYSSWHYHRLPNGVLVVHAHPFSAGEHSKTPFPVDDHKHEGSQILAFDHNSVVFVFVVFLMAFGLRFFTKRKKRISQPVFYHISFYSQYFHLRAPPADL